MLRVQKVVASDTYHHWTHRKTRRGCYPRRVSALHSPCYPELQALSLVPCLPRPGRGSASEPSRRLEILQNFHRHQERQRCPRLGKEAYNIVDWRLLRVSLVGESTFLQRGPPIPQVILEWPHSWCICCLLFFICYTQALVLNVKCFIWDDLAECLICFWKFHIYFALIKLDKCLLFWSVVFAVGSLTPFFIWWEVERFQSFQALSHRR